MVEAALAESMTDPIRFTVHGTPKPQPRPRAFARNGTARVYDPATAEGWKSAIAEAARSHCPREPWRGAVSVRIAFGFARPKAHYRTGKYEGELRAGAPEHHLHKPDCDNLAKAVLDAMTLLGFWRDDCQVVVLNVTKCYWPSGGVEVTVTDLAQQAVGCAI